MEQNKQQTPVDWLVEQLKSQHNIDIERLAVTDKASAMHREQIMKAFSKGQEKEAIMGFYDRGKEYYKEQYEKE